jgi:hypothetical protein
MVFFIIPKIIRTLIAVTFKQKSTEEILTKPVDLVVQQFLLNFIDAVFRSV